MKGYTVFNVEQVEGLPAHYYATAEAPHPVERIPAAEAFFAATGITVQHGGNRAFYAPSRDLVQIPPRESFKDAESYVATLAHETTHATAHSSRLARELGKRFGDQAYAAEELVAEMGSAFLCADLGITPETREDHAAYLAHWLQVLKADSRAIFTAASQAQRAADYLHGDLGKPRPALVIQSDLFDAPPSLTVLPVTSALHQAPLFRVNVQADARNGLRAESQVMVDKPQSVVRERLGPVFGRVDDDTMLAVSRALAVFLGLA